MIAALNEWRRTQGLPTLPTITGRRPASRKRRRFMREWMSDFRHEVRMVYDRTPGAMAIYRRIMEGPEDIS